VKGMPREEAFEREDRGTNKLQEARTAGTFGR
jgi:hypothetical protein